MENSSAAHLDRDWWVSSKKNYIFDPEWFKAFSFPLPIDPNNGAFDPDRDMAKTGKMGVVFWHEPDGKTIIPVGITYLKGDTFTFCYHPDYVSDPNTQPISVNLPKTTTPYISHDKKSLLPFFDNMVSEGWLGVAQRHAEYQFLKKADSITSQEEFEKTDSAHDRYRRMLMFGRGFHGAVTVVDVAVPDAIMIEEEQLAIRSRATLTGGQAKLLGVAEEQRGKEIIIRPTHHNEVSQYLVKIGQPHLPGITINEALNVIATKVLLPDDTTMDAMPGKMVQDETGAINIKRFDRTPKGGRIHFEEALQIANAPSRKLYDFDYKDLARITRELTGHDGAKQLFSRLLVQFMLGNTDGHMKNFGFWKKDGKWELVPNYDLVSSMNYKKGGLALKMNGYPLHIRDFKAPKIFQLGKIFGLSIDEIKEIGDKLRARIPETVAVVKGTNHPLISQEVKDEFCSKLEGRANFQYSAFDRYYRIAKERQTTASRA